MYLGTVLEIFEGRRGPPSAIGLYILPKAGAGGIWICHTCKFTTQICNTITLSINTYHQVVRK